MSIPVYQNVTGSTIDVPTDCGASQRIPPGYFVKGTYFAGIFDAHTTVVDGVTKTFAADARWAKTADWSGLSAGDKAKIVLDNEPGLGNRLQLVAVPADAQQDGIAGQCAQDDTYFYVCPTTGTGTTQTYTESLTSTGGHTTLTTAHNVSSVVSVVSTPGGVVLTEGATADATHFTHSTNKTITFGAAVASPYTYVVTYVGDADRWTRGTMAAW